MGDCPHFLTIPPGSALPRGSRNVLPAKALPCAPSCALILVMIIACRVFRTEGKKAQLGGRNLPSCLCVCFFASWFCLTLPWAPSELQMQPARRKEPGVAGWTHLKLDSIQQPHKPLLIPTAHNPLPARRYRQLPCFLSTPQEQHLQAAQKNMLPAKP